MTACCSAFTTDRGYLFPTLVAAIQARRHASRATADVVIFSIGAGAQAEALFGDICAGEGIRFIPVQPDLLDGANAMMARLLMNRFVPPEYRQFLYIDGDVQISGTLDPLIDAQVPAGRFLAARDPMTFMLATDDPGCAGVMRHMHAIGLNDGQAGRYFNTGMLRISREGWDEIGEQAWAMSRQHNTRFRFPDQDPLNVVGAGRCDLVSLAWNFPVFLLNARIARAVGPRITHFMSNPKPWQGAFAPWGRAGCLAYAETLARYPGIEGYVSGFPPHRILRYHAQQYAKQAVETIRWGYSNRRARMLRYEQQAGGLLPGPPVVQDRLPQAALALQTGRMV